MQVVIALTAASTATASAVIAAQADAQSAPPAKVLQVVRVNLGSDGAINGVQRSDIAQDVNGFRTTTAQLDPSKVASHLPVSVSTVYSHDGVSGTNLADLRNAKGKIVIGVTVSNRTVRTKRISFPVNGKDVAVDALVATPFTVVATAQIPRGAVSSITTPQERGGSSSRTNGTVATLPNGDYQVQWAAILAPPALSPTSTFNLVLDANKFALSGMSLDVEPGVTADPSLQSLVTTQFGADSPLQDLNNNTVNLIGQVQGKLNSVNAELVGVKQDLTTQVKDKGSAAVLGLKSSTTRIDSSLNGLEQSLNLLRTDIVGKLTDANTTIDASFDGTLAKVLGSLGVDVHDLTKLHTAVPSASPTLHSGAPASGSGAASSCATPTYTSTDGFSVYGQLANLRTQLDAVGTSSAACLARASSTLGATIDSIVGTADCTLVPNSLTCLSSSLSDLSTAVTETAGAQAANQVASETSLQGQLASLGQALGTVACAAQPLDEKTDLTNGLGCSSADGTELSSLIDLKSIATDVSKSLADVSSQLTGVSKAASAAYTKLKGIVDETGALGSAGSTLRGAAQSLAAKASAVESAACNVPTDLPSSGSGQDYVKGVLKAAGISCGPDGDPVDSNSRGLVGLANANTDAAQAVLDAVLKAQGDLAPGPAGPLSGLLGDLTKAVGTITGQVSDLSSTTGSIGDAVRSEVSSVFTSLNKLGGADEIKSLSDLASPANLRAMCADPSTGYGTSLLAQLRQMFAKDICSQKAALDALSAKATGGVASAKASADALGAQVRAAGATATAALVSQGADLSGALSDAGSALLSAGERALKAQASALSDDVTAAKSAIAAKVRTAINALDKSITGRLADVAGAKKSLLALTNQVLQQLGTASASGVGIFGQVFNGANRVGDGASTIKGASAQSSQYKGVRTAQIAGSELAQKQQQAGTDLASAFPAFAETLPAGSSHSSVFDFTIGRI